MKKSIAISALVSLIVAAHAQAQTPESALDEIVVSATKKETNLKEIVGGHGICDWHWKIGMFPACSI